MRVGPTLVYNELIASCNTRGAHKGPLNPLQYLCTRPGCRKGARRVDTPAAASVSRTLHPHAFPRSTLVSTGRMFPLVVVLRVVDSAIGRAVEGLDLYGENWYIECLKRDLKTEEIMWRWTSLACHLQGLRGCRRVAGERCQMNKFSYSKTPYRKRGVIARKCYEL